MRPAPRQCGLEQRLQHFARRLGAVFAVGKRLLLFHVGALRQLQLYGMDVMRRVAVMPGDVAAFEAPVKHMAVTLGLAAHLDQPLGQARVATGAIERAQVEVRQPAIEQVRDQRTNRVGIPQQRVAVGFRRRASSLRIVW